MEAYNSELFNPPAPVARVAFRNSATGVTWDNVPMLLDTGADITLIPEAVVEHLGAEIVTEKYYQLRGFDNSESFARVVRVDMLFLGRAFRGHYSLIDQDWGILGRNVLNALPLLFDGPQLSWGYYKQG
jgi:Aspartyl protease